MKFSFLFLKKISIYPTGEDNTSNSKLKQIFDSKIFFLGQHHMRKTTLEDVLMQRALQPKEGLFVAVQIAKAIVSLHRTELVHRQIGPQKILVAEKSEVSLESVRLI